MRAGSCPVRSMPQHNKFRRTLWCNFTATACTTANASRSSSGGGAQASKCPAAGTDRFARRHAVGIAGGVHIRTTGDGTRKSTLHPAYFNIQHKEVHGQAAWQAASPSGGLSGKSKWNKIHAQSKGRGAAQALQRAKRRCPLAQLLSLISVGTTTNQRRRGTPQKKAG